ncbi:MAG: nitroreductase family protein [Candidatus Helarchaeales archaeon]
MQDILELIKSRRSIRKFEQDKSVDDDTINKILEAGRWAPSGLNNQPWRFMIIRDPDKKKEISECTKYGSIILGAPVLIVVFFDQDRGYNRTKDIQAIGACIQNMLLAIHGLGLGAVWLGEILNQRERVEEILDVSKNHELQAVIALGYPVEDEKNKSGSRVPLERLILKA